MGDGNAHVRTITSLRVCMKKLTQGALILIVLSAVTVQFLHLPHSPKKPFCPDCSGLKSTADSFDALTEIEVESKEPVSNHGERLSFGEEIGVLTPGCSLPGMLQARGTL